MLLWNTSLKINCYVNGFDYRKLRTFITQGSLKSRWTQTFVRAKGVHTCTSVTTWACLTLVDVCKVSNIELLHCMPKLCCYC